MDQHRTFAIPSPPAATPFARRLRPWAVPLALAAGLPVASLLHAASLTEIFPAGATEATATGISPDGRTVVGYYRAAGVTSQAFRWTAAGGFELLPDLPGGNVEGEPRGVSEDGLVVVGRSSGTDGLEAVQWSPAGEIARLGVLAPNRFTSHANAVSWDGSVIVGQARGDFGDEAFRWTEANGMVALGDLRGPGQFQRLSEAHAVSGDGSVLAGTAQSTSGIEAFRWTEANGMIGLGDLPGSTFSSEGYAISDDGTTVVGRSRSDISGTLEAFRWTQAGGMAGLGDLPGGIESSEAYAVSGDGSIVVGRGRTDAVGTYEAFLWDQGGGMRNLREELTAKHGLADQLNGWILTEARGISPDGLTIVGTGTHAGRSKAWIAQLDPPPQLVITEIMYRPNEGVREEPWLGKESAWEWIEVYNAGEADVDLAGFVIDNGDSNSLPWSNITEGIVPAGEAVVIYNGAPGVSFNGIWLGGVYGAEFHEAWGSGVPLVAALQWSPLADTGGKVGIWQSYAGYLGDHQLHSRALDTVDYTGFPVPQDGESIFLTALNLDNSVAANWAVSDDPTLPPTPLNDTYQSAKTLRNSGRDFGSPYQNASPQDWADLPDASVNSDTDYRTRLVHDGPRHVVVAGLRLGAIVDAEPDGTPSLAADGDDLAGSSDDEDGITMPSLPLTNGGNAIFEAAVTNRTGRTAHLAAFVDWNGNGSFRDPGERFEIEIADGAENEPVALQVAVPANARTQTNLGARFRLSTAKGLAATGPAPDGEVEDYLVQTSGTDWGDLPDTGPGTGPGNYRTLAADGGPSHILNPLLSFVNPRTPGDASDDLDAEPDGQPATEANGDDANAVDDEPEVYGVYVESTNPVTGQGELRLSLQEAVTNRTGLNATLYAFLDINRDGDFDDAGERQTDLIPAATLDGASHFSFIIPHEHLSLSPVPHYLRLRLSTDGGLGPDGPAPDGEVADHRIYLSFTGTPEFKDFGDLPDVPAEPGLVPVDPDSEPLVTLQANNGPAHIHTAVLTLGAYLADGEADGQPTGAADGDDLNGADDENGIVLPASVVLGSDATFAATATNHSGVPAYLLAFVDWNGDGAVNAAEERAAPLLVPDGSSDLPLEVVLPVPVDSVTGRAVAVRFRLAVDPELGPNGAAGIGEVEDYFVKVETDSDGDGLGDRFELARFGNLTTSNGGETDTDRDGSPDVEEEKLGTDPTDPGSPRGGVGPFPRTGALIVADSGNNVLLRIETNGAVSQLFDPATVGIPGFTPDFTGSNFIVAPADGVAAPSQLDDLPVGLSPPTEVYLMASSDEGPFLAHLQRDGTVRKVVSVTRLEADSGLADIAIIGLALGSNGKIFALDGNGHNVLRVDPLTGQSRLFTPRGEFNALTEVDNFLLGAGVVALPAGELAVIDTDSDSLLRIGYDGTPAFLGSAPAGMDLGPASALTRSPSGDLFAVDANGENILRFRSPGTVFLSRDALERALGGGPKIRSISADSDGRLTVLNVDEAGEPSLHRFEFDGSRSEPIAGSTHLSIVLSLAGPITLEATGFAEAPPECDDLPVTRTIVRSGDLLPFLEGRFGRLGGTLPADLNNDGAIAFAATLSTPSGPLRDRGVFLANRGGGIVPVLVEGWAVPGGGQFVGISRTRGTTGYETEGGLDLNDHGQLAFWGSLRNTSAEEAIFSWDGTLTELVRQGEPYLWDGSLARLHQSVELNENGEVLYRAQLSEWDEVLFLQAGTTRWSIVRTSPSSEVLGGANLNNLGQVAFGGIFYTWDGRLVAIQLRYRDFGGTPIVGEGLGDERFVGAGDPALNDHAEIAFQATHYSATDHVYNDRVFLHRGGTNITLARGGSPAPDGDHYFSGYNAFSDPQINNRSQVAFSSRLLTYPASVGPTSEGLYLHDGHRLQEVARTGQPAPGGATFTDIRDFRLGENGLAFVAEVDASAIGGRERDQGLYVFGGGELVEIMRTRQSFDGMTVAALSLIGINDSLQVAYAVKLIAPYDYAEAILRTDLARALHYRPTTSGSWEVASHWTLGITPHEESTVCIDPEVGLTVTGPAENTTVNALRVAASGSNPASLRLRSSGILATRTETALGDRGQITGEGTLRGLIRGARGSLIAPEGDMALGDLGLPFAFSTAGTINLGPYSLSLDSARPVQLLGLTELRGGSLSAWSGIANAGTLRGDGFVLDTVFNTGEVRSSSGERLLLTGLENSATLSVFGGEFEVTDPARNDPAGEVNCRNALLRFDGGLVNEGLLAFSFGISDCFGAIENRGTSRVIVSGRSNATFWDELRIDGADFRVSEGSTAVFLGDVSGPGPITGTGTILFEAAYSPGASPAAVSIGGDVVFAVSSELVMELGGTTPGSGHDQLDVGGTLELQGGTLRVTLIDGFLPSAGDRFDLFDWNILAGTFGEIQLPVLPEGLFWNTSRLYLSGELVVSTVPETFDLWRDAFFTPEERLDPSVAGFLADADVDGLGNGLEYLLGTDPRTTSSAAGPVVETDDTGTRLQLSFVVPELGGGDLFLEVQNSTDLAREGWTTIAERSGHGPWTGPATVLTRELPSGRMQITVVDTVSIGSDPRRFLRLTVQPAP